MKETDLFEPLKYYLESYDYTVYSEVVGKWFKKRADVVATREDSLVVFEMKTSLTFKLIDQARFWMRFSETVNIVIPKKKTKHSETAIEILTALGIGLIEIDYQKYLREAHSGRADNWSSYISQRLKPNKNVVTTRDKKMFDVLTEEHKTWAKGGSGTGVKYVTPYALLMNDVYKFLRAQSDNQENGGWVSSSEIWEYLEENSKTNVVKHYKNPKPSIASALRDHENGDVEHMKIGRSFHFKIMEGSEKYLNMGETNQGGILIDRISN